MPYLSEHPIDPAELLTAVRRDTDGGIALFVGVVREANAGRFVQRMDYEAYGPMAERELERIAERLKEEHPQAQVLFRHRVGSLLVGEVAVVVAAAAPHRAEAFAACRAGIEAIKATVPIWKREWGPDGASWVDPCEAESH